MSKECTVAGQRPRQACFSAVRSLRLALAGLAATIAQLGLGLLTAPVAAAFLQEAAGDPGGEQPSVAAEVTNYANQVADLLIWLSIPGATLGAVVAGTMLMSGSHRAREVAMGIVIGLIVVVSAKGIAA